MAVQDMHIDFKLKFNKLDSSNNRNFLIPEIDMLLNDAYLKFVKSIVHPRVATPLGFEKNQRITDDIKVLLEKKELTLDEDSYELPDDYMFYISSDVHLKRFNCTNVDIKVMVRQHDDHIINWSQSSIDWGLLNVRFRGNKIYPIIQDKNLSVPYYALYYIRKLNYIHNAANFRGGNYRLANGTLLEGTNDCELPEYLHNEIVDLAVLLASSSVNSPDYNSLLNNFKNNN